MPNVRKKLILKNPANAAEIKTAKLQKSDYDEHHQSAEEEIGQKVTLGEIEAPDLEPLS